MFNVGFEFEMYYPMDPFTERRKDPYDTIVADYKDWFVRDSWLNSVKVVYEGSLAINRLFGNKFYQGCELITPPLPIADAKVVLRETFIWMKERGCKTTKECGFHINISFTDSRKMKKMKYTSLISNVPQEEILRQFKRSTSQFCMHTNTIKVSIADLVDSWSCTNAILNNERSIHDLFKLLDNPTELINALRTEAELKVYDIAEDNCKELSIVPKISDAGKRYYEFRMIGNKDYHLRHDEISRVLDTYTKAMKNSL